MFASLPSCRSKSQVDFSVPTFSKYEFKCLFSENSLFIVFLDHTPKYMSCLDSLHVYGKVALVSDSNFFQHALKFCFFEDRLSIAYLDHKYKCRGFSNSLHVDRKVFSRPIPEHVPNMGSSVAFFRITWPYYEYITPEKSCFRPASFMLIQKYPLATFLNFLLT